MPPNVRWQGKKIMALSEAQVARWLNRSCLRVVRSAKASMREGGTDTKAIPPGPPGSVPMVREGALKRAITFEIDVKAREGRVGVAKDSPAERYGIAHELGAVISAGGWAKGATIHIPKRPFLRPALDRESAEILQELRRIKVVP